MPHMAHPLTEWLRTTGTPRRELARRVGVTEAALRAIEHGGGATLETGLPLAEITGLPLHAFLPKRRTPHKTRKTGLTDPAAA